MPDLRNIGSEAAPHIRGSYLEAKQNEYNTALDTLRTHAVQGKQLQGYAQALFNRAATLGDKLEAMPDKTATEYTVLLENLRKTEAQAYHSNAVIEHALPENRRNLANFRHAKDVYLQALDADIAHHDGYLQSGLNRVLPGTPSVGTSSAGTP